jgi:hypothetical protein
MGTFFVGSAFNPKKDGFLRMDEPGNYPAHQLHLFSKSDILNKDHK